MSRRLLVSAAVLLSLALAALITLVLPVPAWRTGRLHTPPLALQPGDRYVAAAQRVWIDTDAACGAGARSDPDDCLAMLLLARAQAVELAGVSTVFGNAPLAVTDRTTRQLAQQLAAGRAPVAVHRGAATALASSAAGDTPAQQALRDELAQRRLTIVALGPLTNVAAALRDRPSLQAQVDRVIAVMGRRPGHLFHPAEGAPGAMLFGHGPVFRDLNLVSDADAAAAVVRMRIPLVLVPYDAARRVELTAADLARMRARGGAAAWVAERATGWLAYWRDDIGRAGFYPFDALAAAFALRPALFRCASLSIRVGGDERFSGPFRTASALLVDDRAMQTTESPLASGTALYCPEVVDELKAWLADRLVDD